MATTNMSLADADIEAALAYSVAEDVQAALGFLDAFSAQLSASGPTRPSAHHATPTS